MISGLFIQSKKFLSVTVILFMLASNITVCLSGAVSLLKKTDICVDGISVSSQYKFVKNAPKEFVNLCVNVSRDISNFNVLSRDILNLTAQKNINGISDAAALMVSGFKLKTVKMLERFSVSNINLHYGSANMFYLFMIILIFYLIGYIGLLRVFNDVFYINKQSMTVKLCL